MNAQAPYSNQELIKLYMQMLLSERRLSQLTCVAYQQDIEQLLKILDDKSLLQITADDLRNALLRLRSQQLSARSMARKLSAWRSLWQWLDKQQYASQEPIQALKAPKIRKALPSVLSVDEAVGLSATEPRLNNQNKTPKPHDLAIQARDHAIFELFYSSGLRLAELLSLDYQYVQGKKYQSQSWLDIPNSQVIVTGKRAKRRSVPVGEPAMIAIKNWLQYRVLFSKEKEAADLAALFISERGYRLSRSIVHTHLKRHAKRIGLPTNVHAHMLRHSFASHLLQSSGDLRAVQELLGHQSITSTQVYTHLDFQHLAKVYDATHPRAK